MSTRSGDSLARFDGLDRRHVAIVVTSDGRRVAMPRGVPFANVFSVGDLLIGAGIALVIVLAMRSARAPMTTPPAAPDAAEA